MHLVRPRSRRALISISVALFLLTFAITALPIVAQEYGEQNEGQFIYDRADLLTESEIEDLERDAQAVEDAGAPVVVYLQRKDAGFDETLENARQLMEEWDVQTAEDARDGVVIFLNLEPDDPRRGQLALVAGESHFDGGNLPQRELDRITDDMRDVLGDDETAEGISLGLNMIAESLEQGPPPPPEPTRAEEIANSFGGSLFSPWNVLAALGAVLVGIFTGRVWRSRPTSDRPVTRVTDPPGNLMPAIAGALVVRNVSDSQMEATILDLARRDAVAFEPEDDKKKIRVRLLDAEVADNKVEELVWEALESEADDDGVVTHKKLAKVRSHWSEPKQALKEHLEERGWFDPDAGERRIPLYIVGVIGLALAIAGLVIAIMSTVDEPWALIGAGLIAVAGFVALLLGASMPYTTLEGEEAAKPWHGYLEGLKNTKSLEDAGLNLDEAVPYAVAMNSGTTLNKQLERASEDGYSPLWLGRSTANETWGSMGFYPYWIGFHAAISPSAGAGTGAGGAAAGSGGSGGGF